MIRVADFPSRTPIYSGPSFLALFDRVEQSTLETSTSCGIADGLFEAVAAAWNAMGEGEGGLILFHL